MQISPFKCSVFWASLVVVIAACWVLNGRLERGQKAALAAQQAETQLVAATLFRAFHTDNYLTYAAVSRTTAHIGDRKMESVARIIHAPQRLSISYQTGDYAGQGGGYNRQWTWRQIEATQSVVPYVELERPTDEIAAQRFALMLQNYRAKWKGREVVSGRQADVIRLTPMHPVEGARGPARKLWIDTETGLTLRQQSFNFMMMKVMESVLSDVDFSPRIDARTFVSPQSMQVAAQSHPFMAQDTGNDRERVARLVGLYPPEAKQLPPGFQFDSVGAHRCDTCRGGCYSSLTRYTDGLNTLSLFALKPHCSIDKAQKTSSDKKHADGQSCEFGPGTLSMRSLPEGQLIVVADLPLPVLKAVLDSTTIRPMTISE